MLTLAQREVVLLPLDAVYCSCHLLQQDINCAPYGQKFLPSGHSKTVMSTTLTVTLTDANALWAKSFLIDGEAVRCGVVVFQMLRQQRNGPRVFLYTFDLVQLDGWAPPRADRDAKGSARQA